MEKVIDKVITENEEDTKKFAALFAKKLKEGDIIGLIGELGTGKTVFTKGIAYSLNIKEPVTSPSFNLVNVYNDGDIDLFHFDLYRLNSIEELENIGYEEYFYSNGITVIEWADKCIDILNENCYLIYLKYIKKDKREIKVCQI